MLPPGTMVISKFNMGDAVFAGEVYTVKKVFAASGLPVFIMLEELGDTSVCVEDEFEPIPYSLGFTAVDMYCDWWKRECHRTS